MTTTDTAAEIAAEAVLAALRADDDRIATVLAAEKAEQEAGHSATDADELTGAAAAKAEAQRRIAARRRPEADEPAPGSWAAGVAKARRRLGKVRSRRPLQSSRHCCGRPPPAAEKRSMRPSRPRWPRSLPQTPVGWFTHAGYTTSIN
jgi:hypothetical protein